MESCVYQLISHRIWMDERMDSIKNCKCLSCLVHTSLNKRNILYLTLCNKISFKKSRRRNKTRSSGSALRLCWESGALLLALTKVVSQNSKIHVKTLSASLKHDLVSWSCLVKYSGRFFTSVNYFKNLESFHQIGAGSVHHRLRS